MALFLSILFGYFVSELHVIWHVWSNNIERKDIAEDYGFAFENFTFLIFAVLISFSYLIWLFFRIIKKFLKFK